ncbi:hypothetical protein PIB30_004282 [Stylosanthes scabra]|uniref:Uncharacterized protein n=1 Tax=Stylosanthes scabra TaxID=79078 RepID=A0ABU6T385_9FABA|nr:hypothetical protein [Stylosanthes scabra]
MQAVHTPVWVSELLLPNRQWNSIRLYELFTAPEGEDSLTWSKERSEITYQKTRCELDEESVFHCLCQCPDSVEAWRLAGLPAPSHTEETWKWWLGLIRQLKSEIDGKRKMEMAANLLLLKQHAQ